MVFLLLGRSVFGSIHEEEEEGEDRDAKDYYRLSIGFGRWARVASTLVLY